MKALPTALLCGAMVLSCGSGGDGTAATEGAKQPPVIRFAYCWTHGFTSTLKEYGREVQADFTLVPEPNNGIQHRPKILIDVSSDNLPDVFTFWSYETNLKYFVDNGFLVDIQEIFDASPLLRREDFHDYALEGTEFGGRNYAIPYEWFYGIFVVNKEILDRCGLALPRTWDDLLAMTPVLREQGIIPISMGSYLGDPGHLFYSALAYQAEGGHEDAAAMGRTRKFDTPANRAAAKAALELARNRVIPEDTVRAGSWDYQINQYNQGRTAMTYTFNWTFALFDPAVAEKSVIIPVPRIRDAADDPSGFTVGGLSQSICVSKASWNNPEKRPHIIRFLEWLLSDRVFALRMGQEGCVPAKKMALPQFSNPIYAKAAEYVQGLEVRKLHEFYFDSMPAFENFKAANDLLWSGAATPQEFLDQVESGMAAADE